MQFFKECNTLEEVKKLYKTLAKQFHPDRGGDTATMQKINNEYAMAVRLIAKGENLTAEETESIIMDSEAYQSAVNAVINLQGITVELVGAWLWVTGETKQHKEILKDAKFKWAKKKTDYSAWFFRTTEWKTRNRHKMSLDDIRTKYGTQTINKPYYSKQIA